MDTPTGLLVPNVKDVQNKSLLEIAHEVRSPPIRPHAASSRGSGGSPPLPYPPWAGGTRPTLPRHAPLPLPARCPPAAVCPSQPRPPLPP